MPYLITPIRQRLHTQTFQHTKTNIHRDLIMNLALCFVILHLSVHAVLAILLMKKLKLSKVIQFVQIHTASSFKPLFISFLSSNFFKWSGNQRQLNSNSRSNTTSNSVSFARGFPLKGMHKNLKTTDREVGFWNLLTTLLVRNTSHAFFLIVWEYSQRDKILKKIKTATTIITTSAETQTLLWTFWRKHLECWG